ncbi:MAG: lysylphosphatidylglycerol synthase transmembrane domain-containing protein [Nannocystaceae bacterium]|nr:flippase-like domain-containing protein [bacterium]
MDARGARRPWLTWGLSLVGAAVCLWLASRSLQLWPDTLTLVSPGLLAAAAVMHVPYAIVRALRLQYVFDPLVARCGGERISRRLLYGSGFVSFFVLLVLPLKLGELSRPMLLARGRQRGLGLAESVGGVALERLVDGLIIVAMLFGGLALSDVRLQTSLADVRTVGASMLAVFAVGLVVLVLAARMPGRAVALAEAISGLFGERARALVGGLVDRVAGTMRGVLALDHAAPFIAWSLLYWAITAGQLWLVLEACGIHLTPAAAAAIVAVVGLSIQLPGGPAQAGTFQLGAGMALSLYLDDAALQTGGSSFAAVMYMLQFAGAGVMALPGLALLARVPEPSSEAETPCEAP